MNRLKALVRGFTVIELVISLVIICILAVFSMHSYKNYTRRAYYSEVIASTAPYRVAIAECYQDLGSLVGCDAGTNNIPVSINSPTEAIASLKVSAGVITVVPLSEKGILKTDTYILTPKIVGDKLKWDSSGGGVSRGYAK